MKIVERNITELKHFKQLKLMRRLPGGYLNSVGEFHLDRFTNPKMFSGRHSYKTSGFWIYYSASLAV